MVDKYYSYPNRTLCAVLEDIRRVTKKLDTSRIIEQSHLIRSLTEEAQVYANRMEAGLEDQKDIREINEHKSKLVKEIRKLEKQIKELKTEKKKGSD